MALVVGVVSRFLSNPGKEHWNAVKWILRYLRGTSKLSLCYGAGKLNLVGYTDSDMVRDIDSRKRTCGYLITFAGELWLGNLGFNSVWHFLLLKQGLLQQQKLVKRCYG